jgi:hypothetical protein
MRGSWFRVSTKEALKIPLHSEIRFGVLPDLDLPRNAIEGPQEQIGEDDDFGGFGRGIGRRPCDGLSDS